MRRWLYGLLLLAMTTALINAIEVQIDQNDENRQRCAGMYSRSSWGGDVDPYILIKFSPLMDDTTENPIVSLVIFEWNDVGLIGIRPTEGAEEDEYICDQENVDRKLCNSTEIGEFILAPDAAEMSKTLILTQAVHLKESSLPGIHYDIKKTGYYCVGTFGYSKHDYTAVVEFRNAYGELPGSQIAKLPFYGSLTIVYAVLAVFWGFFYAQHRHDILAVQNYITAIVLFLIIEMLMTWGFYDYQNRHGANLGSKALMIVVAVLNAGRNSFSFFLLLIVCMGYGVVKPSLGKTMIYVRWLAAAHFLFGLIYSIASLMVTPDSAGPLVLFVILPLAGTLTAFYVWTLNSLNHTMKDLGDRKQNVKAGMYRKLWYCILISILIIFGFFFFNSFTFAGINDPNFVPRNWKTRWFILDGWLNLVYFGDVAFICYMWLPTANNRRFAMSDELAQDDEGFEIADFGAEAPDSGDEEDARLDREDLRQDEPSYDPPIKPAAKSNPPAQPPRDIPRDSLDGETIFAVGEDGDKWSDDDADDSSEGKNLVGKRS